MLSPTDRGSEIEQKVADYLNAGPRLVWVVFPDLRRIRVHTGPHAVHWLTEEDTLTGDPVLPGFCCSVREILEA